MGPGAAAGVVAPIALGAAGKLAGAGASTVRRVGNAMRPEAEAPTAPASVVNGPGPAPAEAAAAAGNATPASVVNGPGPAPAAASPGLSPTETSALGKFVRVAKPDVNAMTGKAAAYSGVGIDPTLVDSSGRRGQAIVRALASRPTPAQDNVEAFADQRRVGLASRMSNQARQIISSDPRTPEDIAQSVIDARNQQANEDFGPVRNQMVNVTPAMADAMTSPFGIRAIRTAWERAVDPDARTALRLLYDHVNPGQGGQEAGSLDGTRISVGQAQDISKALFDDADSAKDPGDAGPMKYFGKAIREGASKQAPDYEVALGRFANASGLGEAPAIGKQLLSAPADTFAADVDRIRAIPSEPDELGNAMEPQGVALARPGARRAIEIASGGGRPGTAMGVAQTLADAPEQQAKNAALLGDADAQKLQDSMRLERQAVLNAANASPGAGSNTFLNALAGGAVNGEVDPGEVLKTVGSGLSLWAGHPLPAAGQAMSAYLKATRAFSDDEAEALAQMAIDPTKHDDALNFIASRAGPQAAQAAAPMMQNVAAGAGAVAATAPPSAQAPNAFQPQGPQPAP
jgi:hypothetical protein